MNITYHGIIGFLLIAALMGCVSATKEHKMLPPGVWRAVMYMEPPPEYLASEEVEQAFEYDKKELPFTFDVDYINTDSFTITIHNGKEDIMVDHIYYGRDLSRAKDTLLINFPVYDSYIKGTMIENVFEGQFVINYKEDFSIPIVAHHGVDYRFSQMVNEPSYDISGKWEMTFLNPKTQKSYTAIGEFAQDGAHLTGTFRTETGDYRFLEGEVDQDKFYLSVFDGSHAYLFEGKIQEKGQAMAGTFYFGPSTFQIFEGSKNNAAELADPFALTRYSDQPLQFALPNHRGESVDLSDPVYQDKYKLIQLMGTWCPNCRDETRFLKEFYKKKPQDVEIIAVSMERYRDDEKSINAIKKYKEQMDVPYSILYGGYYDKKETQKRFPQLEQVLSYPTLVFLNKDNTIFAVHTGFNGPATSKYKEFVNEFDHTLESLRKNETQ